MKRKAIVPACILLAVLLVAGLLFVRAQIETQMAAAPLQPTDERDFLYASLTYDEGTRTLRGTQTMTITNRTGQALEEIVLRAYMNGQDGASVSVSGAAIGGDAVRLTQDEDDPTVLRAAHDWAAGETVELTFTLMVKHAKHEGAAIITLPSLAMFEDGAWRTDEYDTLADPSYAEAFDFSIALDGESVAKMRAARDASFALFAVGKTRTQRIGDVQVTVLAQDGSAARLLMAQTKAALESLEDIGLQYPFGALTVAQSDTGREDGLALSGLIALSAQEGKEQLRRRITRLIARETFGVWVESDPWNDPWLSVSLASSAELLAYRRLKGASAYEERFYGEVELATRLTRPYGVTVGSSTAHFGGDGEMTQVLRDQGAAMLLGIEQAVGEETFIRVLQSYSAQNAGKTAQREALAAALREASGSSWDGYLIDGLSF